MRNIQAIRPALLEGVSGPVVSARRVALCSIATLAPTHSKLRNPWIVDRCTHHAPHHASSVRCFASMPSDGVASSIQASLADYEGITVSTVTTPSDRSKDIFVNNQVRMDQISVVGFDYDYTLANYNENVPQLVYSLAMSYLVDVLQYPTVLKTAPYRYDPNFAIRGLSLDSKTGWLLKLSSYNTISTMSVFEGKRRVSTDEILKEYDGSRHMSMGYRTENTRGLMDMFSMSEACLIATVSQFFMDHNIEYTPSALATDISSAIEHVHVSGIMHDTIQDNLSLYLDPDPGLRVLLDRLRENGKKVFLLTNSTFKYVNAGLKYLIGEDWCELFDVTIVSARKPQWYTDYKPFRELDTSNLRLRWTNVTELSPGRVYSEGNVHDFERLTGFSGRQVLYIGDNLVSDMVAPRRILGWTTGCVINELDKHMNVQDAPEVTVVERKLAVVDELLRYVQMNSHDSQEGLDLVGEWLSEELSCTVTSDPTSVMDSLEQLRSKLFRERHRLFHPLFGSMMFGNTAPTLFAFGLMRYVDLYTSHVTNLLGYDVGHRFYPHAKTLPHMHRPF